MSAQITVRIVDESARKVREELLTLLAKQLREDYDPRTKHSGLYLFLERRKESFWRGKERKDLVIVEDCVLGSTSEIVLRVYGDDAFRNLIQKLVESFANHQYAIQKVTIIQDDEERWESSIPF